MNNTKNSGTPSTWILIQEQCEDKNVEQRYCKAFSISYKKQIIYINTGLQITPYYSPRVLFFFGRQTHQTGGESVYWSNSHGATENNSCRLFF